MKLIANILGTSVGRKYVMAVTGFFLFLFVVGHMVGNLQVFLGPEAINRYAHFLQSNVELLWPVRIGLLVLLTLHVWSAILLSLENKAARPVGYAEYRPIGSTYASRTMLISGLILFCFLAYHLLHYTVQIQAINLTGQDFAPFEDAQKRHDVYRMIVVGFRNGWVTAFYVVGVGLLCLHLSHGASSLFQSLGWRNEAYRRVLDRSAQVVAWVIWLGYISIPLAVLCGLVGKGIS